MGQRRFPQCGWYLYMSKSEKTLLSNLPPAAVRADPWSEGILLDTEVPLKKRGLGKVQGEQL